MCFDSPPSNLFENANVVVEKSMTPTSKGKQSDEFIKSITFNDNKRVDPLKSV